MSEIILRPSLAQKCIACSMSRGLKYSPSTGQLVPMNRAGTYFDYSIPVSSDRTNTPSRNREWYAKELNKIDLMNYIIYTKRAAIDFYVPPNFLDFSRYEITGATLKLYCRSRIPNGGATPYPSFGINIFDRTYSTNVLLYNYTNDYNLYYSLDDGVNAGSMTISGANTWYQFSTTDASFLARIYNTYLALGHISIGLVGSAECNYPTSTEDSSVPGYDGAVVDRNYDYNDFTQGSFSLFEDDEDKVPQLVISYQPRDEAGTINSMSITQNKSKYSSTIDGIINISDPEEENQTLNIEAKYALPGGTYGSYELIDTNNIIAPNASGTNYTWSADISQPIQNSNLIYSLQNWLYDKDLGATNVTWTGTYWHFNTSGTLAERFDAGRLKPNTTYRITLTTSGSITMSVLNDSTTSVNPSIEFDSGTEDVDIVITGSVVDLTDVKLEEITSNEYYYSAQFRAMCAEPLQSGNLFYPSGILLIDNRVPTDVVITEENSLDGVFQSITPSGNFEWTASSSSSGISGYLVAFSAQQYPLLSEENSAFVNSSQRTYNTVAPFEGRWYLGVAPVTNSGITGNTSSYGFYYNTSEGFVETSGMQVNSITLSPSLNTWVSNIDNPRFEWTAPTPKVGNSYLYDFQCGTNGGVESRPIEHLIDWDLIDPSATEAFFRLTIKDNAGIIYITKSTDDDVVNWEYFDGAWHELDENNPGLLRSTSATKIRYTLQSTDSIPDGVSLHSYIEIGWFDVSAGGVIDYSYMYDPRTMYFGIDRGYIESAISETVLDHIGTVAIRMGIKINGGAENFFLSTITSTGFLYREQGSAAWQQLSSYESTGVAYYKINIEPYMNVPINTPFEFRWKFVLDGVDETSWRQTITNLETAAPDGVYEWVFSEPEINESSLQNVYYIHNKALENISTTYYARVRVFDGFEYGDWSRMYKFKVNLIPSAPTGLRIL